MNKNMIGVDIGGTKCAVSYGIMINNNLKIIDKQRFATTTVRETIENILSGINKIMKKHDLTSSNTESVGISCGGPLDSIKGIIMSPPNLPGWNKIPIVKTIEEKTGIKTAIQNDANACALAEWKFGAGKGTQNMVFLTFGTGLGSGLILNGKLYSGTNDNAGEIGHIRLSEFGPVGYGKAGSFEGFVSGGGIAQLAKMKIREKLQMGESVEWCPEGKMESITTKEVAEAANLGDKFAKSIFDLSSSYLGKGLAMIIDILNPEMIVIGSIYTRNEKLIRPIMIKTIEKEALLLARNVCTIKPAELGEQIGDYAALSVAVNII
ncbi:MAG: ROK family protein [Prolixibacteraceae bacterium]|nr:ROK family protein [Prolixibacteraceae bacterium]